MPNIGIPITIQGTCQWTAKKKCKYSLTAILRPETDDYTAECIQMAKDHWGKNYISIKRMCIAGEWIDL